MEPLSLYGNNPKTMMYRKFGHLSGDEKIQRRKALSSMIDSYRNELIFHIKRLEALKYPNQSNKWMIGQYDRLVNNALYWWGMADIEQITLHDIIVLDDAPYKICI